jgi:hypothetical protein
MKIYVSGPLTDTHTVRQVQNAVLAAGHELTLDWSADVSVVERYATEMERSARMARDGMDAVLAADAVLVVASQHDGRGMFVEFGAALARASCGDLEHVVLVGNIHHESVFYFHPLVQRVAAVKDWLAQFS